MAEIPASLGQYVLLESLSESRTGTIHKAKHRTMGRVVAVKILSTQASRAPDFVKRFERKMKILAGLNHPNLAAAYEGGQHEGTYYLVMEYVDGQNLAALVKSRGPLPVEAAVEYGLQAAAALGYAHEQGVYHRNVRPDHLMIDRQGLVKVVGFGLAHVDAGSLFSEENPGEALTRQGLTIGTPEYMAPEQAANAAEVDQRADVYSLGCTLYALLTGKPPYPSKSLVQQMAAHALSPIPSLRAARPEAPPALDSVLRKMMAKRAEDRYASMAEVAAALDACLAPVPASDTAPAKIAPISKVVAATLVILALVAVLAIVVHMRGRSGRDVIVRAPEASGTTPSAPAADVAVPQQPASAPPSEDQPKAKAKGLPAAQPAPSGPPQSPVTKPKAQPKKPPRPPAAPKPTAHSRLSTPTPDAAEQKLARIAARDARYAAVLEPAEAIVAGWDFRGAEEAMAKIRFAESDLAARLAARRNDVRRLAALKARMIEKINAANPPLTKRALLLRGFNGTVARADDQAIETTLPGDKSELQAWRDLSEKSVQKLVQLAVDPHQADDWLAAAVLACVGKDTASAEKYLDQAAGLGGNVAPYQGPLAAARLAQAKALVEQKQFVDAQIALDALERKYGAIPWFALNLAAIHSARQAAESGLGEAAADELYAEAAKRFAAKEPFELRAALEKLKADYPASRAVTDARRRPSFAEMQSEADTAGKMFAVRLDGKGDFKSVQEAIDAASPNSRIEIQDGGPYREHLEIPGKTENLTIRGGNGQWPVITSQGTPASSHELVRSRAPQITLEHVILANNDGAPLRVDNSVRLRSCIVWGTGRFEVRVLDVSDCVILADACVRSVTVRDCVWAKGGIGCRPDAVHCVNSLLQGGMEGENIQEGELRSCTLGWDGRRGITLNTPHFAISDCIVGWVDAAVPFPIEHCNVNDKKPFRGKAAPGKGCIGGDPQFVDPKHFDYHLLPTSPCLRRASDNGAVGTRFTPKMVEMFKQAQDLRARGVIVF
jgi:serine/threonine-protein kinase